MYRCTSQIYVDIIWVIKCGFLKTVVNTDAAVNKFLPIVKDMANKIGEHVYKNSK